MPERDHKKMKKAIGLAIETHRKRMDLSQEQLAILVYGKKNAQILVSRSEEGKRKIPTDEIIKYIKAFRTSPDQFFRLIQSKFNII